MDGISRRILRTSRRDADRTACKPLHTGSPRARRGSGRCPHGGDGRPEGRTQV